MKIEKALTLFEKIESDRFIQSLIAQGESKALLINVNESLENFPNYTESLEERLISIALSYISIGCSLAEENQTELSLMPLEKGASILENIYSANQANKNFNEYFLLVSSLAYYAAHQYSKSFIVLKQIEFNSDLNKMVSYFLKRNFDLLSSSLNNVLLNQNFSDTEITNLEDEIIAESMIYTVILSKGFSLLLEFIYTGEQKYLIQCKEYLLDLLELLSIDREPSLWWVVRLLSLIIDGFNNNSFWTNLPNLAGGNKGIIKNYILALAFHTNPVIELFKSQKSSLPMVLGKKGGVISIPTSSGKTRIAEIAMIENLTKNPDSLILYLAPFRALAYEIEESLSKIFKPLRVKVSQLYGGTQFSDIDKMIVENSNVIIATPEKAKAMVRSSEEIKNKIKLIIIDEGHLLGPEIRYIRNELFIEELRYLMKCNEGKLLFLSAILPNAGEIAQWITEDEDKKIESTWRPSKQRFGFMEYNGKNVNLIWKDGISFNNHFINPFPITKKRKDASYTFPKNKKQAYALAALKFSTMGIVLMYVGKQNMVLSQAREILIGMGTNVSEHSWKCEEEWQIFRLICIELEGNDSELLKLANHGILCHHGGLSNELRVATEKLMRKGNPKIIVATSTLSQGVNIGVSTIIVTNVWLGQDRHVSSNDFWNLAGRAGRSFTDKEGKILYALDVSASEPKWRIKRERDLANILFDVNKQKEARSGFFMMIKTIINFSERNGIDFEYFLQLIAENNFSKVQNKELETVLYNVFDVIDDTLLALESEYSKEENIVWIEEFFRKSLAYIQAKKIENFDEERLIKVLKARHEAVINLSNNFRKELLATSLPLQAGIFIRDNIETIRKIGERYLNSNKNIDDLMVFLSDTENFVVKFPSLQFTEYDGKLNPYIMSEWIQGEPIGKFNSGESKFCKEFYGYTLPWGINAISKMLSNLDFKEEASEFEELAILVQIGLPNIKAVKIYLSGITTRSVSKELSSFFTVEEIDQNSENLQILILSKSKVILENVSELTGEWMKLIIANTESAQTAKLDKRKIINLEGIEPISEILNLKQIYEKFFLCSPNFDEIIELDFEKTNNLSYFSNDYSYYFEKSYQGDLELKVRNPYLKF